MNKRWQFLSAALICVLARPMCGASLDDAARVLARRVLAALGPGENLAIETRTVVARADNAPLERLLKKVLSTRLRPRPTVKLVVTISENARGPLLVAEVVREEDPVVFLAPYDSGAAVSGAAAQTLALDPRAVIEQDEPILDIAIGGMHMAVLEPARVVVYERNQERWHQRRAIMLRPPVPVRDPRGRAVIDSGSLRVYLPGLVCHLPFPSGEAPQCEERDADWPLQQPGDTNSLRASLAPGRNYFDAPQPGPFFSAARWGEDWAIAPVNGPALLVDASVRTVATLGDLGTDITVVESSCPGPRYLVGHSGGALQAFRLDAESRPVAVTQPLKLDGRLTAAWPAETTASFTAIVQSADSGRYAASRVSLVCSR